MTAERHYFVLVNRHQFDTGRVLAPQDLGGVALHLLVEGEHVGDLTAVRQDAAMNYGQIAVENLAGGILTGRLIDLGDILGWAIERGYLEDPDRFKYEDCPL
jgi:hypothetical protein